MKQHKTLSTWYSCKQCFSCLPVHSEKNILGAISSWPQITLNLQLEFHHPCVTMEALKCTWKYISLFFFLPSFPLTGFQTSGITSVVSYLLLVILFIVQMLKKMLSCLPRSCNQNKAPACLPPLPIPIISSQPECWMGIKPAYYYVWNQVQPRKMIQMNLGNMLQLEKVIKHVRVLICNWRWRSCFQNRDWKGHTGTCVICEPLKSNSFLCVLASPVIRWDAVASPKERMPWHYRKLFYSQFFLC